MKGQATLSSTSWKVGLLLFSLVVLITLSGCQKQEESDPLVVPFSNGPSGPPSVTPPDTPPPA